MAVIHYWIQLENRKWDASSSNRDRMTGQSLQAVSTFVPQTVTLSASPIAGSQPRQVTMYNPIRTGSTVVDALILRRYRPPTQADGSDAWTVPDDRKVNPWDINERNPGESGTRGTIPGPTIECSVGDSVVVHFKNADGRAGADVHARTHSLHPHGFVFEAAFDGAYPLSPPDPNQPVGAESSFWSAIGVAGASKQGDRVPAGGTFDYRWNTAGWPTTAGVWLYHDHSVNDMENVELGAIGMIIIHNANDPNDVDVRLPTPQDPTAFDPALMPGGSPAGSPIVRRPFVLDTKVAVAAAHLARAGIAEHLDDLVTGGVMDDAVHAVAERALDVDLPTGLKRDRMIDFGPGLLELRPGKLDVARLFLSRYRIPPQRQVIMQLYHQLHGVGFVINGRHYLGNTPTVLAGVDTKMRFGVVGMGSDFHTFHLHGHRWIIPGPHGANPTTQQFSPMDTPVSQFEDTRVFGPANSFVFTIEGQSGSFMRAGGASPDQALGEWHMHCHVLMHMMTGMMGSLLIVRGGEFALALPEGRPPGQVGAGGPTATTEVHITTGFQFVPQNIMVSPGTTVKWIWDHAVSHTVSSDAALFDSGILSGGPPFPEFSFTFNSPGTVSYHCNVHPSMTGSVMVM